MYCASVSWTLRERFSVDVSPDDGGRASKGALHERALVREFHPDGRVVGGRGVPRAFYDVQGLVHAAVRVDEKVAAQTALVVKRAKTIAGTSAPIVVHDQLRQRALEVRGACRHQLAVRTADATSTVPRTGTRPPPPRSAASAGDAPGATSAGRGGLGSYASNPPGSNHWITLLTRACGRELAGDGDLVAVAGDGGVGSAQELTRGGRGMPREEP